MIKKKKLIALGISMMIMAINVVPTQACAFNWSGNKCGSYTLANSTTNHDGKGCKRTINVYTTVQTCNKGKCSAKITGQHDHSVWHSTCNASQGSICKY